MVPFSRRGFFALSTGGLLLPRRLVASPGKSERKFLFVFCPGGWDPTMVFAPIFNETTDHMPEDELAQVGDLQFTTSVTRPSVQTFFEQWGSQTCLVNGLQVPSVAHDVCKMLSMTGSARGASDDWASLIGGLATSPYVLPNLHVAGPIYPLEYADATVRVGLAGQLPGLVDGGALSLGDVTVAIPGADRDALEEAFVRARLDQWAASTSSNMASRVAAAEQLAMVRSAKLVGVSDDLMVEDATDLYSMARVVISAFSKGLSRSGVTAYGSGGNGKWDTHSTNDEIQDTLFETLFDALNQIMADLASTPGDSAETLLEETTVVVLSEMGRTPELNTSAGKDHWTWTSAMLIGSGVAGGRMVGKWKEDLSGEPVDLTSGEASASGVTLLPGHIGATLLALADIDPAEHVDPAAGDVIWGAISD